MAVLSLIRIRLMNTSCATRLASDRYVLASQEVADPGIRNVARADGAAAGAHIVFGVILGTGVGGGIVVGGQILKGCNAVAGEWGHNPLPWPQADEWPGEPCYCGRSGCIETFLSGRGLSRDYLRSGGEDLRAEQIIERAIGGDPAAMLVLDRYRSRFARTIASVINVLDPDVIVLGSGLSNLPDLVETVPPLWMQWVFSDSVATRFRLNVHGDSSGVRGAAWLWPD